jgi:glycosyltransferase involved in cell wall biosynthesis
LLAIVIPYYKLSFFEKTLESLAVQTDKRFNVYVGNDASPENPEAVLNKYNAEFSFQYKAFETNLGSISLVKQWERCLEMIQDEEWIMILGDDDTLEPNVVASFYENLNHIQNEKSNVVRFATQIINQNDEITSKIIQHPILEMGEDFLIRKFKYGVRSTLSEFVFKRIKLEKVRFKDFPLAWFSDLLAVFESTEGSAIYSINDTVVNFRLSGLNITSKNDDLLQKNKATFYFYKYLLYNYGKQFSTELVVLLYDRLEKAIFDNKKNLRYWMVLFSLYIKYFQWGRFLSLGLKIKKSMK